MNNYCEFIDEFEKTLYSKINDNQMDFVFLCIGTDKIIGDSFGPLVGSFLKEQKDKYYINNLKIVGDMDNIITYKNINYNLKKIKIIYNNPFIISIDAALSKKQNIGKIYIEKEGLNFGESLKKENKKIGNMSIKYVVGPNLKDNIKNFEILKNSNINHIVKNANLVANGIIDVMYKKEKNGKNIYI